MNWGGPSHAGYRPLPQAEVDSGDSPAVRARLAEWTVTLQRSAGESLGVFVKEKGDVLEILEVTDGTDGLVGKWNAANPCQKVLRGDRIVEVCGTRGEALRLKEQVNEYLDDRLTMVLQRPQSRPSGSCALSCQFMCCGAMAALVLGTFLAFVLSKLPPEACLGMRRELARAGLGPEGFWNPPKSLLPCSENEHVADEATMLGSSRREANASAPEPFDCGARHGGWLRGWSAAKERWCCEAEGVACTGLPNKTDATDDPNATDSASASSTSLPIQTSGTGSTDNINSAVRTDTDSIVTSSTSGAGSTNIPLPARTKAAGPSSIVNATSRTAATNTSSASGGQPSETDSPNSTNATDRFVASSGAGSPKVALTARTKGPSSIINATSRTAATTANSASGSPPSDTDSPNSTNTTESIVTGSGAGSANIALPSWIRAAIPSITANATNATAATTEATANNLSISLSNQTEGTNSPNTVGTATSSTSGAGRTSIALPARTKAAGPSSIINATSATAATDVTRANSTSITFPNQTSGINSTSRTNGTTSRTAATSATHRSESTSTHPRSGATTYAVAAGSSGPTSTTGRGVRGDPGTASSRSPALESCVEYDVSWHPLDMLGVVPFAVEEALDCLAACEETWMCAHWTYADDGGVCHLQDANATKRAGTPGVQSGPERCSMGAIAASVG